MPWCLLERALGSIYLASYSCLKLGSVAGGPKICACLFVGGGTSLVVLCGFLFTVGKRKAYYLGLGRAGGFAEVRLRLHLTASF